MIELEAISTKFAEFATAHFARSWHASVEDYDQLYLAAKQVIERRREIESIDEQSTDTRTSS